MEVREVRIIAGKAGGIRLKSIKTAKVRPTLDRVKEAIFNMISQKTYGSKGLDLFAGFGGLGLEAVSRGAEHIDFVEKNYKHVQIIKKNIAICGFAAKTRVNKKDVYDFLKENINKDYDLIFMDPPYGKNYIGLALEIIEKNNLLARDGLIIIEHHKNDDIKEVKKFITLKDRNYGDTVIKIYKYREEK